MVNTSAGRGWRAGEVTEANQRRNALDVPLVSGHVRWGKAVVVALVGVCPQLTQRRNALDLTFFSSHEHRGAAVVVGLVGVCPQLTQRRNARGVSP